MESSARERRRDQIYSFPISLFGRDRAAEMVRAQGLDAYSAEAESIMGSDMKGLPSFTWIVLRDVKKELLPVLRKEAGMCCVLPGVLCICAIICVFDRMRRAWHVDA